MGVGSSREIEEQLEAALALLDSARTKQEQLNSENDALQARITAQAASLLLHEDASSQRHHHLDLDIALRGMTETSWPRTSR